VPFQEKTPEIKNLFTLMELVSPKENLLFFEDAYNQCSIRYGDFKKQLAEDMINYIKPLREKIVDLENNEELLKKIAKQGAEKARESASATLTGVQKLMGLSKIW
jgi:tryptophanyl-tRNA synthetase